jgi:hypothetical protein
MFSWFKSRQLALAAVTEALQQMAADRRAEAARTEALLTEMREQRRQDQDAFLGTLKTLGEQNAKIVEGVTGAVTAQANAISEHLSLFKTTATPVARTTRDEDEYRAEMQRYSEMGLPEEELADLLHLEQGLLQDIDLN